MGHLNERDAEALFNIGVYEELSERDQFRLRHSFINSASSTFEEAYELYYGEPVVYETESNMPYNVRYLLVRLSKEMLYDRVSLFSVADSLIKVSVDEVTVYDALESFVFTRDLANRLRYALSGSDEETEDYRDLVRVISFDLKGTEIDSSGKVKNQKDSLVYNGYLYAYLSAFCQFTKGDVSNILKDLEELAPDQFSNMHLVPVAEEVYAAFDDISERG